MTGMRTGSAAALLEARLAIDLEGAALQRLAVVDQADLGGGAAHVEGQDAALAALERDAAGQDGAAGRPGLDEAYREAGGRLEAGEAAARGHQVDRLGRSPARRSARSSRPQVARHQRLHVGVGDGRGGALVLARLRADLATTGVTLMPRTDLGQDRADALLVRGIGVGVDQRHGDRLDAHVARARLAT